MKRRFRPPTTNHQSPITPVLRVIAASAAGRMGSRVAALAAADQRFLLAACLFHDKNGDSHGAPALPQNQAGQALTGSDTVVIFSTPDATVALTEEAAKRGVPTVIGTTGFSKTHSTRIQQLSREIPIFLSANFSPGVNVMAHLCAQAARLLPDFDAAISETHHRLKKDAPSGTALMLGRAVEREGKKAAITSQRIGTVIGEHTVSFAGFSEKIEVTHRAGSRDLFARGALEAALWLKGRKPGLYGMNDLLNLGDR